MKCGFCNYTDGVRGTSNPPQVICRITGKSRFIGSDCDAFRTVVVEPLETHIEMACLICGEGVPVPDVRTRAVVCEKCKEAVMKVRADLERDPCVPILD